MSQFSATGRPVEWVAATRAASAIPFGAVSHLLPENGRFGADRLTVLRGIADHVAGKPADRGVTVIAVDDAHLLDDPSAAVVHHLALRSPVFLLITIRDGERCPDAVTALWKEGLAGWIELPRLRAEAIDALLDQAFGHRLDTVSRYRLSRVSGGNPLLLRETLRAVLDTGSVRYRHGVWRWDGSVRPTRRLVEVVAARLGTLEESVAGVLEVIACGEPLPVMLLERLSDAKSITTAERRGLVIVGHSGNRAIAWLSHPLYGEVIRSTTAQTRARRISGELAATAAARRTPMCPVPTCSAGARSPPAT